MRTERDLKILAMRQQGKSLLEIARHFCMSVHRVVDILKEHERRERVEAYLRAQVP